MDENKYGFEPFEAAIALITTQYISDHVSRTELGRIINPRVIAVKDWTPISTEIDFPALAELLNAALDWYKSSSRGYEEKPEQDGSMFIENSRFDNVLALANQRLRVYT